MPAKEPLLQHEFEGRPWYKISADLCEMPGRTLLVVMDYYSNFIEVERVPKVNTSGVTKALKPMFARYGVPVCWCQITGHSLIQRSLPGSPSPGVLNTSPLHLRYPQSNGKAENAVKTVKRLFNKCRESGQSEYLALLDWRNTPSEGLGTSPAQRFLGRRCKTRLPVSGGPTEATFSNRRRQTCTQRSERASAIYYNRQARPSKESHPEKEYECGYQAKQPGVRALAWD